MMTTKPQNGRATIREVARLAGVSVGTVSNVINGRARVRPATRLAVEGAIAQLGFTPHAVARMLIARRGGSGWAAHQADRPRITCVGFVSTDYTARIGTLPHRADRMTAERIEKTLGGPAANVAVAAVGLGAPYAVAADVMTVLGDDPDSDWAVSLLAERGVALVALGERQGRRLARCMIMVEANGARTILYETVDFPEAEVVRLLEGLGPARGRHAIHWQGLVVPSDHLAARAARRLGYVTSLQTSAMPAESLTSARLAALVRDHDLVFLNRESARAATGWQGPDEELLRRTERIIERPPGRIVLLTLSEAGAVLFDDDGAVRLPAPPVEPVDTTGAGDAFAGVFLASWLNGAPARQAARLAVAAGSRAVTAPGAQEMRLSGAELSAILAESARDAAA